MSQIEDNDKIKKAIIRKLTEMDKLDDGELPDYILVMVNNRRDKRDMEHDLNLFLGDDTKRFIDWLFEFTRRGARRGYREREEGEIDRDIEREEERKKMYPKIGNQGLRDLVKGMDDEDQKKEGWAKINPDDDDEIIIKGSDEDEEDWKKRKDRKRELSPGERKAIEKMNKAALERQKAGTLKGALAGVANMRNTTINDDFLRRAEMAKKDGILPKHAIVALPRAVAEEQKKEEVSSSSRDRDRERDRDRDRDRDRRDRRDDRDRDRGRDRDRDRDRRRDRSRSKERDSDRSKNYVPPAINPHLNPRKKVEKPKGMTDLAIGSFPHMSWNVNNGKSTNDAANSRDTRPNGFKAATFAAIGGDSSEDEEADTTTKKPQAWEPIKSDWSDSDHEEKPPLNPKIERKSTADSQEAEDPELPPTPDKSENGEAKLEPDMKEEKFGEKAKSPSPMEEEEKQEPPPPPARKSRSKSPPRRARSPSPRRRNSRSPARRDWRNEQRNRSPPRRRSRTPPTRSSYRSPPRRRSRTPPPMRRRSPPRAYRDSRASPVRRRRTPTPPRIHDSRRQASPIRRSDSRRDRTPPREESRRSDRSREHKSGSHKYEEESYEEKHRSPKDKKKKKKHHRSYDEMDYEEEEPTPEQHHKKSKKRRRDSGEVETKKHKHKHSHREYDEESPEEAMPLPPVSIENDRHKPKKKKKKKSIEEPMPQESEEDELPLFDMPLIGGEKAAKKKKKKLKKEVETATKDHSYKIKIKINKAEGKKGKKYIENLIKMIKDAIGQDTKITEDEAENSIIVWIQSSQEISKKEVKQVLKDVMAGKKVEPLGGGLSKKEKKKHKKKMKLKQKIEAAKATLHAQRVVRAQVQANSNQPQQDSTISSSTDVKVLVNPNSLDATDSIIHDPKSLQMVSSTPASLQPFGYHQMATGEGKNVPKRRVSVQGQTTIQSVTQNTDTTTKIEPRLTPKPANAKPPALSAVKVDLTTLDNDVGTGHAASRFRTKHSMMRGKYMHNPGISSPQISAIAVNVHSDSSSSGSSSSSDSDSDSSDSDAGSVTVDRPGVQVNEISSTTPDILQHLKPLQQNLITPAYYNTASTLPPITSTNYQHPLHAKLQHNTAAAAVPTPIPDHSTNTTFTRTVHGQNGQASEAGRADSSTDSIQDMTAAVKRLINDPTKISSVAVPQSIPVPMTFSDRSKIMADLTNDALVLKHQSLNESYQNAIYDPDADKKSIVVNNVHYLTADIELRRHFEIIGTITRVTICKDRFTGKPAGRAYIQFHDAASVELAKALDQTNFNGRPITVQAKYNPNGPTPSTFSTNNQAPRQPQNQAAATSAAAQSSASATSFRPPTTYTRPPRQSKYNWVNPALAASNPPSTTPQ